MGVLENSVSVNKTLSLFQFYFDTFEIACFFYIIIIAKYSQLCPSVLGLNFPQMYFAWCQKMERRLEKMGYLQIQYQLIKRCHFFSFTLTRRDSLFFLYNHYSTVQLTFSLSIGLKYSSNVLCLVSKDEEETEKKCRYLQIQYQLIKRCHFFSFTLTRRESVFFLYNHYIKVQSNFFLLYWALIFIKCDFALCQKMD